MNDDASSLADATFDFHPTPMQRQQSLYDRYAETGPVVATVIGRPRLEEWLAGAGGNPGPDANPGVLDLDDHMGGFMTGFIAGTMAGIHRGGDSDDAAAIGEFDGVGEQVQHDLEERPLVGDDPGQF